MPINSDATAVPGDRGDAGDAGRRGSRTVRVEALLAVLSAVFAVLTLVWKDWIEIVFRFDPDRHSGSLEWLIAGAFAVVGLALALLARRRHLRLCQTHQRGPAGSVAGG